MNLGVMFTLQKIMLRVTITNVQISIPFKICLGLVILSFLNTRKHADLLLIFRPAG